MNSERGRLQSERAEQENDPPRRDEDTAGDREQFAAQVELLAQENRQLRSEYIRSRQANHRRTAFLFVAVSVLVALGGFVFPASQRVLFALTGLGLFSAILIYYLTPERFIASSVGECAYTAFATVGEELATVLDLQETSVYVPTDVREGNPFSGVRLFVPQHPDYLLPDSAELESVFVVTDDQRSRGLSLQPTGAVLYHEFETSAARQEAGDTVEVVDQLVDALVNEFELADSATPEFDDENRLTIDIRGSAYGLIDRFDHPIASFVATGLTHELRVPVTTEVDTTVDGPTDCLLTCRWDERGDD